MYLIYLKHGQTQISKDLEKKTSYKGKKKTK